MSWQALAQCRGADTEIFYPERGQPHDEAKALCAQCVVKQECLDYAMRTHQQQGIWGGLTSRERRRYRSKQLRERIMTAR